MLFKKSSDFMSVPVQNVRLGLEVMSMANALEETDTRWSSSYFDDDLDEYDYSSHTYDDRDHYSDTMQDYICAGRCSNG